MNDERKYAVLLKKGIGVEVHEKKSCDRDILETARRLNECQWIETKHILDTKMVKGLSEDYVIPVNHKEYILLLDEEGKLKEGNSVNFMASYLYGTPLCGDAIVGNAVIVKAGGEDLELLTKDEAHEIATNLSKRNTQAHACASVLYAIVASGQIKDLHAQVYPNMGFVVF